MSLLKNDLEEYKTITIKSADWLNLLDFKRERNNF